MSRPRKRSNIPLTLVRPSKQKRVKVDRVSATLPASTTTVIDQPPLPSEGIGHDSTHPCGDELDIQPEECQSAKVQSDISSHTRRKERAEAKWDEIRAGALRVMIEESSLSSGVACFACGTEDATVRCLYCGPQHFFCERCAIELHTHALYHHCPEVWRDGCYIPLSLPTPLVTISHVCETMTMRAVTCFHIGGIPRSINFQFCSCESDCIELIRRHYWPATSTKPQIAFDFHFLDWLEALLLECQVAVQDMTQAISFLIKEKIGRMPCQLYPVLIDSFEEYRHAKNRLRSLESIVSKPLRPDCPACPKGSGTLTIAIDALFGLCRKKAAGSSVRSPLSGDRMFEPQHRVNAFVENYKYTKDSSPKGCNNFLAGDALRSKTRYRALDETGVLGAVCRHEVPLRFFNLHHGERISYAVFLMKKLKELFPNNNVQLMYDIACLLHKHIEAHQELKDAFCGFYKLAIPIFHCYGHKLQCQIRFGPRNLKGFGLSDGEGMERMWSFLRRFSRMTKEMRQSHRVDVLTDAIVYYAEKSVSNIGVLLDKRIQRAHKQCGESKTKLHDLMASSQDVEPFVIEDVEHWLIEENAQLSRNENDHGNVILTWEEEYVKNIDLYHRLRNELGELETCDSYLSDKITLRITQTEKKLKTLEDKHHLSQRWFPECVEYKLVKENLSTKIQTDLLNRIKDLVRERWVLLRLKAKYADGLALACRLSKRITAVSAQIKKNLSHYNEQGGDTLTWETAINLHSRNPEGSVDGMSISHEIKHQAVGHLRVIKRCEEEVDRLKDEMMNCMTFYYDKIEQLQSIQQDLTNGCTTRLNMGSLNLVQQQLRRDHMSVLELQRIFSKWIPNFVGAVIPLPLPIPTHSVKQPSSLGLLSTGVGQKSPLATNSDVLTSPSLCQTLRSNSDSQSTEHPPVHDTTLSVTTLANSSPPVTVLSSSTTHTCMVPIQAHKSRVFVPRKFQTVTSSISCDTARAESVSGASTTSSFKGLERTTCSSDTLSENELLPSIREPETLSTCYSEDEESSGDEEMTKQYWRAERFHMEEYLKEQRAKEPLTLDTILSESDRKISITTTKEPAAAVMRLTSFLKKSTKL